MNKILPSFLCLVLAGCASWSKQTPTGGSKQDRVASLLAYHQSLRRLSALELGRELQALKERPVDATVAMQKALLYGLTHDSADLARAQVQLATVLAANDAGGDALKPLAQLLVDHYAEMRRLNESVEKTDQQAKDSQRRLEQMSEKLEALKNIERSLVGQPSFIK